MTGTGGTAGDREATPAELAEVAAEAIRALIHVTSWRGGYVYPSDVDAVIGSLHALAARLRQALDQADRWLAAQHAAGRVGLDQRGDVGTRIRHLHEYLELAACDANLLAHSLDLAHAESTHLTGPR